MAKKAQMCEITLVAQEQMVRSVTDMLFRFCFRFNKGQSADHSQERIRDQLRTKNAADYNFTAVFHYKKRNKLLTQVICKLKIISLLSTH